jgi:pimeloyl-ACP methyl ester carboxylesterase
MRLAYRKWGNGYDIVLALHGYGRSADDFDFCSDALLPTQSLVAIDLFGHGLSTFDPERNPNRPLVSDEWIELIAEFLVALQAREYSLLAYSLGGRLALCLLQSPRLNFRRALLIAPDGLKMNRFYWLICNTTIGQALGQRLMRKPQGFLRLIAILSKCGILNEKLKRFIFHHLRDEESRNQLFIVWIFLRKSFPDLALVRKQCGAKTQINFVFGEFDQVIRPSLARKLIRVGFERQQIHFVKKGHHLIQPFILEVLAEKKIRI